MKFKYLEYAVMIQYCHSISKAAEKLYVSQPALSETINRMEEELGFIVFKRTNKGIEITPLGEKFIQDAEEILQIKSKWDVYAQQSTDLLEDISEEVHLALTPSLCDVFIASFFIDCVISITIYQLYYIKCQRKIFVNIYYGKTFL